MIVAICFFYQALVDGSFSVIAVFMPHFLSHFDAGNGRTALVGSVFMASMLVSGLYTESVSVLINISESDGQSVSQSLYQSISVSQTVIVSINIGQSDG